MDGTDNEAKGKVVGVADKNECMPTAIKQVQKQKLWQTQPRRSEAEPRPAKGAVEPAPGQTSIVLPEMRV